MYLKYKHIALADDDCEDKEMLKEALEKICPDIHLTLADDGATLLNILKTIPRPDFIILDINMPLIDGKECLKVLKNKQTMKAIPVMMYSTSSNNTDIQEAFSNGADYYVLKPNSMAEINKLAEDICTGTLKSSFKS